MLSELHGKLAENGNTDLHFIGINSRQWPAKLMASELVKSVKFNIYQSTVTRNLWSQVGGLTDDLFIYDK
jgi:hypothetical protein